MDSHGLPENNLEASSIEPMVGIDSVPQTLNVNSDQNSGLHTPPLASSLSSHNSLTMDGSPHPHRNMENRGSNRLSGGITLTQTRPGVHQNSSQKGKSKSQNRVGISAHSMKAPFEKSTSMRPAMSVLQSHPSHSSPQSMQVHQSQAQYHINYDSQKGHHQGMGSHQMGHSPQLNLTSTSKFSDESDVVPNDGGRNGRINQNGHAVHTPHSSPHDLQTSSLNMIPASRNHRSAINSQSPLGSNPKSHSTLMASHSPHSRSSNNQENQYISHPTSSSFASLKDTQHNQAEVLTKLEAEVVTLTQDIAYFRHVMDFQSTKIDKLTLLIIDLLHNKESSSVAQQLQNIQASDPFSVPESADSVPSMHDLVLDHMTPAHDSAHDTVHVPIHEVETSMASIPSLSASSLVDVPDSVVLLESSIEPLLHQVAQAAVQAQTSSKRESPRNGKPVYEKSKSLDISRESASLKSNIIPQQSHQNLSRRQNLAGLRVNLPILTQRASPTPSNHKSRSHNGQNHKDERMDSPKSHVSFAQPVRKDSMSVVTLAGLDVVNMESTSTRKKPKLSIDFLHNPTTVEEIYIEFTKGFRGQPPLRELDQRFGKFEWRGDSRTKESKRYQRRKKLCEAIERGMLKYHKSAEEIIRYIEDFRKTKSLTWVMNGNLPEDLTENSPL